MDIKQLQKEFLEETANHYNLNNRSTTTLGCCIYYGKSSHNKSEGCAIGRKLTPELAQTLDTFRKEPGVNNPQVFNLLPDSLKMLGQAFLGQIQGLHDYRPNWDENGLSEFGKESVESIKKAFGLD